MSGATVLVTGATGFIGGRLVEQLVTEQQARVRVLLRDFAKAARVSRFDVELQRGDLADPKVLREALAGVEVVHHCAYDFSDQPRNLAVARALTRACAEAGVRRLVHLSTFAVYEPLPDGVVTESTLSEPNGWTYKDTKIAIEAEMARAAEQDGLSVVVLQPTIVYGPFGSFWTEAPIAALRTGRVVLPDDANGLCNAVHVDDVVQAMLLAQDAEGVSGERFLVSAQEPVRWREYFAAFERALGSDGLRVQPASELVGAQAWGRSRRVLESARREPLTTAKAFASKLVNKFGEKQLPGGLSRRIGASPSPWRVMTPDEPQLLLLRAEARVSIEKAQRVLGYQPAFDFERGMASMERWMQWAGLSAGSAARVGA